MPKRVAIVGGGLAGLSAAVRLAEAGAACTLFEKRPYLGGRVSSFRDPETGQVLDNGPHLLVGAYRATRQFLKRIGSADKIYFQRTLRVSYFDGQRGWTELKAAPLPAPLHLLGALAKFRFLTLKERTAVLKALVKLRRLPESSSLDAVSLAQWLSEAGQSPAARLFFWDVLALATLNAPPEKVSLLNFQRVLARAFFSEKENARLGWATRTFDQVFAQPAEDFLLRKGAHVRKNFPVSGLRLDGNRIKTLVGKGGRFEDFGAVILALPPAQTQALLQPFGADFSFSDWLVSSPIVTVHLFLKRPVFSPPFVAFIGGTAQWIFNRNTLHGELSGEVYSYSAVISGAAQEAKQNKSELVRRVLRDLRRMRPDVGEEDVLHSRVVKELNGTFVFPPGGEAHRPPPETPLANLFLAGGWTQTGFPDTIESAVLSGEQAAEEVLGFGG